MGGKFNSIFTSLLKHAPRRRDAELPEELRVRQRPLDGLPKRGLELLVAADIRPVNLRAPGECLLMAGGS